MRNLASVIAVAGSFLIGSPDTLAQQASRPNILLLFADDQRADTIAAWGNRHIQTPHLDRLVERGFSFRNNYCFGSNSGAGCVPSRAMLLSGHTWFDVKPDLAGVKLLPELLRENGCAAFATGKWHNGQPSFLRAFPRGKSVFFGGMNDHTKTLVADVENGKVLNQRVAEKFCSKQFADAAIEFLQTYRGKDPFFCYAAFTAPHDPRNPPEKYRAMYYRQRPPLPANFLSQHGGRLLAHQRLEGGSHVPAQCVCQDDLTYPLAEAEVAQGDGQPRPTDVLAHHLVKEGVRPRDAAGVKDLDDLSLSQRFEGPDRRGRDAQGLSHFLPLAWPAVSHDPEVGPNLDAEPPELG